MDGGKRVKTVEIREIDLKYESFRLRDVTRERTLLASVLEKGILEPLQGVDSEKGITLLDGFKRYRCAKKVGLQTIPFVALADHEASGIIQLLRLSNAKSLNILEQARMVDELKNVFCLSNLEIAQKLERSQGWVSMRIGVLTEMPEPIQEVIFEGKFPAYSYFYTLRHFMRMKKLKKEELIEFVKSVSGKNLSTREIELLARGFFQGSADLKNQILSGNLSWSLNHLKSVAKAQQAQNNSKGLSDFESKFIRDLEIVQKYMSRLNLNSHDSKLTPAIYAEGNLLAGGILSQLQLFSKIIQEFYDRTRQA
jgi:ParB/RepB/Spo0J family partition protein